MALSAVKALERAAGLLAEAEEWSLGDEAYPLAMQAVQAYSTYALAKAFSDTRDDQGSFWVREAGR